MRPRSALRPACSCGGLRLIGDVHGDANALRSLRDRHPNAIQIGDLGYGFAPNTTQGKASSKKLNSVLTEYGGMRFFRGNHDHPMRCRRHSKHLASGWHEEGFFVIGGGLSIDWKRRTEGVSWWREEEHSAAELRDLVDTFITKKPRLVLSHEGPPIATDRMFKPRWKFESATARALQAMWDGWQPDMWVFGHWHRTRQIREGKTMFMCLGEKEWHDVHLPGCEGFAQTCRMRTELLGDRLNTL